MQEPVKERVAKLREEIAEIREASRKHLLSRQRLPEEGNAHERRAERLHEILKELASLTDWRKT
jgi:hypothetical protein